ncbi:hypothetical protein HD806DRAFT_75456 [Xylariaceae sp. AK1471]|nr:hypothetical protein HD806DRAFT_75456 [Xylariaceae sp. AK1471]
MDSKQPLEELPPPYTVHASDPASASSSHYTQEATSHLQQHLASLPRRIRSTREAHSIQQSLDDSSLLDSLLPEIEDFLAYLGSLHTTPKLAHLTLVPEAAVPRHAILSGMEEMRRRGEINQVARVNMNQSSEEKKSTHHPPDHSRGASNWQSWSAGQEFSDWGRFGESSTSTTDPSRAQSLLWWTDEDMARRLARILQPTTTGNEPAALESPVQTAVEQRIPAQKEKKGWFWGRKGSTSSSTFAAKTVEADVDTVPARFNITQQPTGQNVPKKERQGSAKMSVTAEEVAFRSENHFGIMESIRGWAVVVVVYAL